MNRILALLLAGTVTGCTCGSQNPGTPDPANPADPNDPKLTRDSNGCFTELASLALTPADETKDLASGDTVTFTATGTLTDGSTANLTELLTWKAARADDTPPGEVVKGAFQPPAGGGYTISATDGCKTGQTALTVKMSSTFQQPAQTTVDRFAGPVVTGTAAVPTLVYPNDQTRFPRNIYKVLFQWKKGSHDQFRLTFTGPFSTTVVYTDGANPTCAGLTGVGCWEADVNTWNAIAGANAGATTEVSLDGVVSGDANVYRAAPITIGFSKRDVRGAIFYWSTSAKGIRRASVSDSDPEAYEVALPTPTMLPVQGEVKCVACHTVSRSGKKMVASTAAATTGTFLYDVTLSPPPNPIVAPVTGSGSKGFGTFAPDDSKAVITNGSWRLVMHDANTGTAMQTLFPAEATQPDWSPRGDELVYADKKGDMPGGASLKVIKLTGGSWENTARTLVPVSGTTSNLFPSYSPDGSYVAYANGKGGHGDPTMNLYLVAADGSSTPIQLSNANHAINNDPTLSTKAYENNAPTWAPSGDYEWIAFNSFRPYGVVSPAGAHQQIWVAAIDKSKLGTGQDPSFPAFRFAFQYLVEDNHRAFWAEDVRAPPPTEGGGPVEGPGGACIADGQACNQTTDSCCNGADGSRRVCDLNDAGTGTVCRAPVIFQ